MELALKLIREAKEKRFTPSKILRGCLSNPLQIGTYNCLLILLIQKSS